MLGSSAVAAAWATVTNNSQQPALLHITAVLFGMRTSPTALGAFARPGHGESLSLVSLAWMGAAVRRMYGLCLHSHDLYLVYLCSLGLHLLNSVAMSFGRDKLQGS